MMGVYRGLIERANEAGDMAQYLVLSQQAAVEAVFPFNNLNEITFQSSFLMIVGFSFAFISLLDGYFFDDPYQVKPFLHYIIRIPKTINRQFVFRKILQNFEDQEGCKRCG